MSSSVHQNVPVPQAAEQPQDRERTKILQALRSSERHEAWWKALRAVPNERLKANEKIVLDCLLHYNHKAYHINASGFFRVTKAALAARTGLSEPVVGRVLQKLAAIGAIEKLYGLGEKNNPKDDSYIWIRLPLLLLASPGKIALGRQSHHGGIKNEKITLKSVITETETDKKTGSTVGTARKKTDALEGLVISSTINPATPDTDGAEGYFWGYEIDTHHKTSKIKKGNVAAEKNPAPRSTANTPAPLEKEAPPETQAAPLPVSPQSREDVARLSDQEAKEQASLLLESVAGPAPKYRCMANEPYWAKYYTEKAPFTAILALAHLEGKATYGVSLSHPDGTTYALCFDGDDAEEWDRLKQATKALAAAGYLALLEKSPSRDHAGGGHLWILFDAPVNARAALHHVYSLAPALVGLERFPHGDQKVRLPGGIYRYGVNVFCRLISVADRAIARNGVEAARLLLSHLTPASIVPIFTEDELPPERVRKERSADPRNRGEEPDNVLDEQWYAKYGHLHLPVGFSPKYLTWLWYQEHTLGTLLKFGDNGLAYAWNRQENVPSVKVNPDGTCTDYGRWLEDTGQTWKGDALEVYCDQTGQKKGAVLSAFAKELVQRARTELEAAAKQGQPIPAWLIKIITVDGRAFYEREKRQQGR